MEKKPMNLAVLTALGRDRIGIVDDLSSLIEEKQGNILESRMAVLGGEFAVIMLVSGPKASIDSLLAEVRELEKKTDLRIEIRRTEKPRVGKNGIPYTLSCVSLDSPGILHSVTRFFHSRGINIENLDTDTSHAPWTGVPLFTMTANIIVPESVSIREIRKGLKMLEQEKDLDISFKAVTGQGGGRE